MTIADQLTALNTIKQNIKTAIEAKGQTVGSIPFSEYPSKINEITGGGGLSPVINEWVRPSDWLPITKPDGTSQKVIGLFAVFDSDTNYVAFSASGAYTVDWGDGSAPENYATNVQCQHKYTFASIDPATTTAEGYRQVVITITPQAGQNLISINFQKYHSEVGGTFGTTAWLELYASTSNADVLGGLSNWGSTQTMIPMLKAVYILPCNTVVDNNMGSTMFRGQAENVEYVEISRPNVVIVSSGPLQYCRTIKKFNLHPSISATSCKDLFYNCYSLIEAPIINTTNCTDMSQMFAGCNNLITVPEYQTSNVTTMASMFSGCRYLTTVPNFNTSKVTSMANMFTGCDSLTTVPNFNTSKVTSMAGMFNSCYLLESIPNFDTSNVTDFSSMFSSCYLLESIPNFDTSKGTNFYSMFQGCGSLKIPPVLNTANGTNFMGMFDGCRSLRSIPSLNLNKATNIAYIFRYSGISDIPEYNLSAIGSAGVTLDSCNIRKFRAYGFRYNAYLNVNMLTKGEINLLIENAGIGSGGQQLAISSNPGAALNPTYSRSSTTTAGSAIIAIADTSNFIAGETQVTGTGINTGRSVTFQDAGDTVTLVGHGLPNGKRVSFTAITTTTGIAIYNLYYVVNATTDTFQLSLTQGGEPIALKNNGTGTIIYQTLVIAIDPNVSVTIDVPASATGTVSLAYRNLNTQIAVMKRWTVSG